MARIRTIKPEFFTSEDIVSLSPLARLLFIALWCEADRAGRFSWKPKTFKLRYLPADNCDADELCQELVNAGLVVIYQESFAFIPTFSRHQHLNPREAASQLPEHDASSTREPRVIHASARDSDAQVGREGKGRERKEEKKPATVVADMFEGVRPEIVRDFRKLRQAKKAAITETALSGIKREAIKAGLTLDAALAICCERGWSGFKAEWLARDGGNVRAFPQKPGSQPQTLPRLEA